jgi:putative chitinase
MAIDGRSARPKLVTNPGPYEAIVVSHLDPKKMGTLSVELLKNSSSGNQTERSGQVVQVKYMSPFAGSTPISGNTANEDFAGTQKSYGMWFVPPTPGTKVLVVFAEGNLARGYWIGCIQDAYMNWMTPDPWSGTTANNYDPNLKLPVGEFNKRLQTGKGTNPSLYEKPANLDFYTILGRQGLLYDDVRGPANSSSRRNLPSSVFGISTPGPRDKRDGAPKATVGASETRTQRFSSTLGGSSLVFDDGDERYVRNSFAQSDAQIYTDLIEEDNPQSGLKQVPKGECVRLRTRTGHQILLHNSEDLIYIANAQGSSWIEMTANGKIDIYAQDSVSVRTQNDLNISADRDINLAAARDINMNAGRDYKLTVSNNSDVKVGVDHKIDIGSNNDIYVGADQKLFVGATRNTIITGAHTISNKATLDVNTTGDRKDTQANLDLNTAGYNYITAGGNTDILSGGNHTETAAEIHMNGPAAVEAATAGTAATAVVAAPALWPVRVPVHEPWTAHEHLDPLTFVPSFTQASGSPSPALRETTPLINTDSDASVINTTNQSAANVGGAQTVTPGVVGPSGDQPANPVPVTDLQEYFLSVMIKKAGLDPATALNTADASKLAEGETPGNAEALGMAMAQIQAECGFKPRSENLNYSARRLRQVYPSRVKSDAFAQELAAAGPAAIGNTLYGNRYGNAQNEGYKYRGRGLIQLTFKGNYETYGRKAGHPEIVQNPDLVNDPEIAVAVAAGYINSKTISWDSFDFGTLGEQYRKAVGYANQGGAETNKRIGLGRGFASKMITGDLVTRDSITTEPAGTNIEAGKRVETPISGPQ